MILYKYSYISIGVFIMIYNGIELEEFVGISSPKFKDLSGKKFGSYYVICRGPNSEYNATRFWVECACGKIELKFALHIKHSKSEKCHQCAMNEYSIKSFVGTGDISNYYWYQLQRGAAGEKSSRVSRQIRKFEVTIEQAWDLFLKQDKKCALSGLPIKFVTVGRSNKQRMKEQTASLDRIDSTKDYTLDNVQWVHKDVNRMKNIFDQEYFITMCKNIATTHGD